MKEDYSDIINLPHHESKHHKRMSRNMRAAQFAPFAALTTFNERIDETALQHIAEEESQYNCHSDATDSDFS